MNNGVETGWTKFIENFISSNSPASQTEGCHLTNLNRNIQRELECHEKRASGENRGAKFSRLFLTSRWKNVGELENHFSRRNREIGESFAHSEKIMSGMVMAVSRTRQLVRNLIFVRFKIEKWGGSWTEKKKFSPKVASGFRLSIKTSFHTSWKKLVLSLTTLPHRLEFCLLSLARWLSWPSASITGHTSQWLIQLSN